MDSKRDLTLGLKKWKSPRLFTKVQMREIYLFDRKLIAILSYFLAVMYCQNTRGKISVQDSLGYTYSNPKDSKRDQNIKFWRCSKRNHGCKSTITVQNDFIISRTNSHNHWKQNVLILKIPLKNINPWLLFLDSFCCTLEILQAVFLKWQLYVKIIVEKAEITCKMNLVIPIQILEYGP